MDEKLPSPTQIGLNILQKNEVPDNSQNIYEIKNNTPINIENGENTAVVLPLVISDFPSIKLPASPPKGTLLNVLQGRTNKILLEGNGDNILINYIKRSDSTISTTSGPKILLSSGSSYGATTASSCTLVYTGSEWQTLRTCILVNAILVGDDETLSASLSYGMPQEAYTSPIILTFTYADSLGNLYPNKTIQMTSGNTNTVISPSEAKTDINGEAKFNVGCTVPATGVIFTAHFINLDGAPSTLNITLNFYNDDSTIGAPEYVFIDTEEGKMTVTIKDTNNDLYPGKNISCSSNQPLDNITVTSNPTDVNGQSFFTISSSEVHVSTISAENKTDNYIIANTATVTFISSPPTPEPPLDHLVARFESDYGVSASGNNVNSWTDNGYGNVLNYAPDSIDQNPMQYDGSTAPSGIPALRIPSPTRYYNFTMNIPYGAGQDYTVCMVGKYYNGMDAYQEFGFGLNACDGLLNTIVFNSSGNYYMYLDKGCDGYSKIVPMSYDWYSTVFTVKFESSYSTLNFYLNNVLQGTGTLSTVIPIAPQIHFYRFNGGVNNSYVGGIYVYDKILDSTELTQLNTYVTAKFGL